MRIPLWLASFFLVACGGGGPDGGEPGAVVAPENRVECALASAAQFAASCAMERSAADPNSLVVRHPDGGFRRFRVEAGKIATADGASAASTEALADGRIEVTVDSDRYRLPAAAAASR